MIAHQRHLFVDNNNIPVSRDLIAVHGIFDRISVQFHRIGSLDFLRTVSLNFFKINSLNFLGIGSLNLLRTSNLNLLRINNPSFLRSLFLFLFLCKGRRYNWKAK